MYNFPKHPPVSDKSTITNIYDKKKRNKMKTLQTIENDIKNYK